MQEDEQYLLKPMNCPHHTMIYKARPRSYKDLPLRLAEFGTVYRYEQSGELGGLTRVRGFTQDDAHIFCMPEQVEGEVEGCIDFTLKVLNSLAFENFSVRLGFRDPKSDKYVGSPERWAEAEGAIERVARRMNLPGCEPELGEAAFYGPKIDFVVHDSLGRKWQLGTVQLDYNLPSAERFDCEYIGADNARHKPVMIHRAPLGSLERFVGVLIEHFAGAFPLWLAPEQVRVLPVSEKSEAYARTVKARLEAAGLRVGLDAAPEKLGAKVRTAQLDLIPMMVVCGPRDEAAGTVSLRDRLDGDLGAMSLEAAVERLREENLSRTVRHKPKPLTLPGDAGGDGEEY
jgi:threonyl-tRNA synthetase